VSRGDVQRFDLRRPCPGCPFLKVGDEAVRNLKPARIRQIARDSAPPDGQGAGAWRGSTLGSGRAMGSALLVPPPGTRATSPGLQSAPPVGRSSGGALRAPPTRAGGWARRHGRHRFFEVHGFDLVEPACAHAWQLPRFAGATNRAPNSQPPPCDVIGHARDSRFLPKRGFIYLTPKACGP
jgi:hypothetical protein